MTLELSLPLPPQALTYLSLEIFEEQVKEHILHFSKPGGVLGIIYEAPTGDMSLGVPIRSVLYNPRVLL